MKTEIINQYYGKIVYNESFWTGKKDITIDGKPLVKLARNVYRYNDGEKDINVQIKGSFLNGISFIIEGRTIQVTPKPKWYEHVLAWMTVAFVAVWGGSPQLCSIFPIIGGAIGCAIAGGTAVASEYAMRQVKNPLLKILIGLGCFAACIIVNFLLAVAFLSAVA